MRVFIELPSWLGDSVMASASIENLAQNFNSSALKIVFFGSFVSKRLKFHYLSRFIAFYILEKSLKI